MQEKLEKSKRDITSTATSRASKILCDYVKILIKINTDINLCVLIKDCLLKKIFCILR